MPERHVRESAAAVAEFAKDVRRHIHQNPELSFAERETTAYVASHLRQMGLEPEFGFGDTGLRAIVRGGQPGPVIALRADMDALPIAEQTGLPFASTRPGVMHACGHDVHTAVLLATARALAARRDELAGQVVLIFQPGEEVNPGGASVMIERGVLENPRPEAIFGLHIDPFVPVGTMRFRSGPAMAAPDEIELVIQGRGGHAAAPHRAVDPIAVAAQVINALQQVVSRQTNPFEPAVLTFGAIHGGSANNVIPDQVLLRGTVRTMSQALREAMPRRIESIIDGVTHGFGASYELKYEFGYPVLVNDGPMTEVARRAGVQALGAEQVAEADPSMGGEDFAFFLQRLPGSFARLGCAPPGDEDLYPLHNPQLKVDEGCLAVGVAYFLSLVEQFARERG